MLNSNQEGQGGLVPPKLTLFARHLLEEGILEEEDNITPRTYHALRNSFK